MGRFVARRLLWALVLLLLVSTTTFVLFSVVPTTDPAQLRAGRSGDPQVLAAIRAELHLDASKPAQFGRFLERLVLHFDLGSSYASGARQPVLDLLADRLPVTVSLTLGAVVLWLVAGTLLGVVAARRPGSARDRAAVGLTLLAISAPVYWLGLVALYLFAEDIGTFVPVFGGAGSYAPLAEDPGSWLGSLLLPWMVLAASFAAVYARLLRSGLIEALGEDHIRTARAKGLSERRVVWRHGMRSAVTPLVTMLGIDVAGLLGGAVLVEQVFSLPGLGSLAFDSVLNGDLPVIQGTVLLAAFFVVIANLLVDLSYGILDPRVRTGGAGGS